MKRLSAALLSLALLGAVSIPGTASGPAFAAPAPHAYRARRPPPPSMPKPLWQRSVPCWTFPPLRSVSTT